MRAFSLLLVTLLAAGAAGCETIEAETCDPSAAANPEVVYDGGATVDCAFSSSPAPAGGSIWAAELLYFPGGMHYALETNTQGACVPTTVQAYLSFDEYGGLDGGQIAQAAGNQVLITGVDTDAIHVANDSCVPYWLLVTASFDPKACASPACE